MSEGGNRSLKAEATDSEKSRVRFYCTCTAIMLNFAHYYVLLICLRGIKLSEKLTFCFSDIIRGLIFANLFHRIHKTSVNFSK